MPAPLDPEGLALAAECARRSAVCWLTWAAPGREPEPAHVDRLVWHAWLDGALLVVDGDGAQRLPGLAEAGEATVTMRSKDTGGRVSSWPADVLALAPDDAEWAAHAAALLAARLNLTDPGAALEGWRDDATVLRLVPRTDAPGPLP